MVKKKKPKAKKATMKVKSVDEELQKVNKKIKKHSKALKLPVPYKTEMIINSELSWLHRLLYGDVMPKIHVTIYAIALGILTYLLGYPKMFFIHFIYGAVLLWLTQYFHKRGDLTVKIFYIGLMIIPLYLIYLQYNDLLSLVMTITFAISFTVSVALYFHHKGREYSRELHKSFTRTFIAEWYAHVISLTLAIIAAYYLPNIIFMNTFYPIIHVILFWIIPAAAIYFFMNKFLYLRFFDPIHPKKDALQGLKHAAAYTVILAACITLGYLLTTIQLTIQEKDASMKEIDGALTDLTQAEMKLLDLPTEVQEYQITKEVSEEISTLKKSLQNRKDIVTQNFGITDYYSDRYFTAIINKREALTFLSLNKGNAVETANDIIRVWNRTNRSTDTEKVDQEYTTYSESADLAEYYENLQKYQNHYDKVMFDNSLFSFVHSYDEVTGIHIFAPGFSRLSKKTYYVTSHLKIFRDMLFYSFDGIVYSQRIARNPEIIDNIYRNRNVQESTESKNLRYAIIQANMI